MGNPAIDPLLVDKWVPCFGRGNWTPCGAVLSLASMRLWDPAQRRKFSPVQEAKRKYFEANAW